MKPHKMLTLSCVSLLAATLATSPTSAKEGQGGDQSAAGKKVNAPPYEGPAGLRFGITSESVAKLYDRVFDAQFVPRYRKTQSGPALKALDNELELQKGELRRRIEFTDLPSALDSSAIRNEFSHNNRESLTRVFLTRSIMSDDLKSERTVKYRRHFFFFADKLWKMYDEYKLGETQLYSSFDDGVARLSKEFGGKPQTLQAEEAAGRLYPTASWTQGDVLVQLLDRSDEGRVALVYVDKSVQDNLAQHRPNHPQTDSVSSEVRQATSGSSSKSKDNSSPADAYVRKRRSGN